VICFDYLQVVMNIIVSAYLDNNIGDDLMLKLLAQRFTEHEFYLYTNKSVITKTFESFANVFVKPLHCQKIDIKQSKVFLTIGGSLFVDLNTFRGQINRIRRIFYIKKLKRLGKKIVTLGCNLGPYTGKIGLLLTKWELRNNNLVTVRDIESLNIIKRMRSVKNYYLGNDIVYNFKKEKIDDPKSIGLGISAYRSLKNGEINIKNYIQLAKIADNYIEKTEKNVGIFAFDSEFENDVSAAHHIYAQSNRKDKISIYTYLGDSEVFIENISKCEKFIAIRFHSAILADILNIPFYPIVYSNKMDNLLNDLDYSGVRLNLDDLREGLNVQKCVDEIIVGDNLFHKFNINNKMNANIHFDRFGILLNGLSSKNI
jgi:colanic acid/amylovoran biosynthesis protein